MSDYDFRPGGSLKLKGVTDGGVKKKKKSSKSKEKDRTDKARARLQESQRESGDKGETASNSGSGRGSPAVGGSKTEAEKRFEESQRNRLAQKVAKMANKTHKDRVNDFNNKLEALSEHHDIPKVGPG